MKGSSHSSHEINPPQPQQDLEYSMEPYQDPNFQQPPTNPGYPQTTNLPYPQYGQSGFNDANSKSMPFAGMPQAGAPPPAY